MEVDESEVGRSGNNLLANFPIFDDDHQGPTGIWYRPSTQHFFRYPTQPSSVLKIIWLIIWNNPTYPEISISIFQHIYPIRIRPLPEFFQYLTRTLPKLNRKLPVGPWWPWLPWWQWWAGWPWWPWWSCCLGSRWIRSWSSGNNLLANFPMFGNHCATTVLLPLLTLTTTTTTTTTTTKTPSKSTKTAAAKKQQ